MKNACRIGKVTPKGNINLIHSKEMPWCARAVKRMAAAIDDQTIMAGFFVIQKNRVVTTGYSYEPGTAQSDMLGACEVLKQAILKDEWGDR